MLKKIISVMCAVVVVIGLSASPVGAYSLENGTKFNRPIGTISAKFTQINHVRRAIEHARPGSTVQIAVYSLDRPTIREALVGAHRRGVTVRVLLNRHYIDDNPVVIKLRKQLATRPAGSGDSRLKFCGGCRWLKGPMHLKFFLLSHTGQSRNVVIFGSGNLTTTAAVKQWNDMVTVVGRASMHSNYSRIFRQAWANTPVRPNPYRRYVDGRFESQFFPNRYYSYRNDPIVRALRSISCTGARGGAGSYGRSVLRISMSSWNGTRGIALAEKVAAMGNSGCRISVLAGRLAPRVRNTLNRANNISVKRTAFDRDGDGEWDLFVHHKYLTVSGNVGGDRSAWVTWAGSSNWSNAGLQGDEMVVRVIGKGIHRGYVRNFNDIWNGPWAYWYTATARTAARTAGGTSSTATFPEGWDD